MRASRIIFLLAISLLFSAGPLRASETIFGSPGQADPLAASRAKACEVAAALEPSIIPLVRHPDPSIRMKAIVLLAHSSSDAAGVAVVGAIFYATLGDYVHGMEIAMSVDAGDSNDYAVHTLALGSDLYQIENLSDLSGVPESGALLIVAPIKLEGGSGGPCRVFAILPEVENKEIK